MNRTNRTSDFRLSGVKAGVRALPDHRAPYIRGGMGHKSALICDTTHFSILLHHRRLPTTTRPDRADTEEKGKTEATPPFLPLYRQTGRGFGAGGVTGFGAYPAPPLWGSLPSNLSLREGGQPMTKVRRLSASRPMLASSSCRGSSRFDPGGSRRRSISRG